MAEVKVMMAEMTLSLDVHHPKATLMICRARPEV
jgi:hypothetical protein